MTIQKVKFDQHVSENIKQLKYGSDWPVVYIINNEKEAYVGETVDASRRAYQHLHNKQKQELDEICVISDDYFNKSVALDLESFLIKYMASDGKYILQNGNGGLNNHNYYNKEEYEKNFSIIWDVIKAEGLAEKDLD